MAWLGLIDTALGEYFFKKSAESLTPWNLGLQKLINQFLIGMLFFSGERKFSGINQCAKALANN